MVVKEWQVTTLVVVGVEERLLMGQMPQELQEVMVELEQPIQLVVHLLLMEVEEVEQDLLIKELAELAEEVRPVAEHQQTGLVGQQTLEVEVEVITIQKVLLTLVLVVLVS